LQIIDLDERDPYTEIVKDELPFIEITNAFETKNKKNSEFTEGGNEEDGV
jgi:hypothetical protein